MLKKCLLFCVCVKGFAGKSNDARQQSQAASSDWGKALAAKAADENNNDFGENVRFSDNVRQKFAKSNQGSQVLKKFFNDDNKRGDNHERLKFNRDDDLDKFGFKNNKRTDSGRAVSQTDIWVLSMNSCGYYR